MSHVKSCPTSTRIAEPRSATSVALWRAAIAACVTFAAVGNCAAGALTDLSVRVVDRGSHGVDQVVVTVVPVAGPAGAPAPAAAPASNSQQAVMDQRDKAFVPGVLVVATGTRVEFPNNDSVSHQVYSFSQAKHFQLPLYKGEIHPPVLFDKPGLVVLGCNIHDVMVGYIEVTDAPYFGTTDSSGLMQFKDLAKGDYWITAWSPYIADSAPTLTRAVHVGDDAPTGILFQLSQALRTRPEPRPRRRDWEY